MPQRKTPETSPIAALATDGRDAGSGWRRYREPLGCSARRGAATCCRCWPRCAARRSRGAWRSAGSPTRPPRRSTRRSWSARPARCRWRGSRSSRAGRTRPPRRSTPRRRRSRRRGAAGRPAEIYRRAVQRIHEHIAAGDTYQVNYTYRLRAPWEGDPLERFAALARAQQSRYAAFIDAGRFAVLSASPELCFRLEGDLLTCRPMKGTAPRGLTLVEDRLQAAGLRASEKERAENVMIVDMVRNDLGRIARVGTVRVPRLWETERYPTLWQMTSTVCAETARPARRDPARALPVGVDHRRPQGAHDADHQGDRAHAARDLHRLRRGARPGAARLDERGDPDARRGPPARTSPSTAPAAGSSGTRGPAPSSTSAGPRRWCSAACRRRSSSSKRWPGRRARGCCCSSGTCGASRDSAEYFGFACDADAIRARLAEATRGLRRPHRVRLLLDERGGIEVAVAPLGLRAVRLGDAPPRRAGARGARRRRAGAGQPPRPVSLPQDHEARRSTSGRWPAAPGATT